MKINEFLVPNYGMFHLQEHSLSHNDKVNARVKTAEMHVSQPLLKGVY